jgi:hypothetical protein
MGVWEMPRSARKSEVNMQRLKIAGCQAHHNPEKNREPIYRPGSKQV